MIEWKDEIGTVHINLELEGRTGVTFGGEVGTAMYSIYDVKYRDVSFFFLRMFPVLFPRFLGPTIIVTFC